MCEVMRLARAECNYVGRIVGLERGTQSSRLPGECKCGRELKVSKRRDHARTFNSLLQRSSYFHRASFIPLADPGVFDPSVFVNQQCRGCGR